ncbi:MAG: tRNA (adenosine(37)-N6)-threonylcarbamoyltransferase complex dimerization subunit type 1 TsaB [Chloroflexota bacterium]
MLLAIDTATRAIGLGLHDGSQVLAEVTWISRGYHTLELAPEVGLLLRRAGLSADALTAVAVAQGPGSFNGLRIGLAMAKGLALAHRLPLVGIPTFDILALAQPRREGALLALIEAGRGRWAGLWYKSGRTGWTAQGEAEALTWEQVVDRVEEPTYLCGELGARERESLAGNGRVTLASPSQCLRRPGFLAELAWERLKAGKLGDPAELTPIYLRTSSEAAL